MRPYLWSFVGGMIAALYLAASFFFGGFMVFFLNPWILFEFSFSRYLPSDSVLFPASFAQPFLGVGVAAAIFFFIVQFALGAGAGYLIYRLKS